MAPLEHQQPTDESPALRKVLCWGRRAGKTRWAFKAAVTGHGPVEHGRPSMPGIASGGDVYWIARDYKQATMLWFEEIRPRFKKRELASVVQVHETDKRVTLRDGGSLWIRSAENIASVRGSGAKLVGVIIDEAAHLNLQPALLDVVLPALIDNEGWMILMSTPNAGPDGYEDLEEGRRTPSYFNIICDQIESGARSSDWFMSELTAFDNPVLSKRAIEKLVEEYPEESVELAQEVYAKRVIGGAGLAFPEFVPQEERGIHVVRYEAPADWVWACGGDWGYEKWGWLGLIATGPERSLVRYEYYFRKTAPYTVGYNWGKMILRFPRPEWQAVDCPAVSDGGPTIWEQLQQGFTDAVTRGKGQVQIPPFIAPPKGPGSRLTKKGLLHDLLKYTKIRDADGKITVEPWGMPRLQIHTDCPNLIRVLAKLPRDPKKLEDVDTDAEDHPYDGITSWAMARVPRVEKRSRREKHPDEHPGWERTASGFQRADESVIYDEEEKRWTRQVQA